MKPFFLISFFIFSVNSFSSTFCKEWSAQKKIGVLNHKIIDEASGIIVSKNFKNRLYHINDSGDGPHFYQTDLFGSQTKKIKIKNFIPFDVEDMTYAKCENSNCLVIGDIGDNALKRKEIKIVFIKEEKVFSKEVTPHKIITLTYPDGAHNAEAIAIHPNGDLFIITKETKNKKAKPAKVYAVSKSMLNQKVVKKIILQKIGELDIPYHQQEHKYWGQVVTSFDISEDGQRILLLTFRAAIEIPVNLSGWNIPNLKDLYSQVDFSILSLRKLPQQEAISYIPGTNSFIYSSEYVKKRYKEAPLQVVTCLER